MLQTENIYLFLTLLPVVSFLYASVGHGGASGYLALMALFTFAPERMKATALLLNLFVAGIAFWYYRKAGFFNKRLFGVFAITSIPFAYLGGTLNVNAALYKKILAAALIFAILKMLNVFGKANNITRPIKLWLGLMIGALIGFFSGLIGIGGGIILSPVIVLLHWGNMKEAAAVSALFIWVNSAAGLLGQLQSGISISTDAFLFVSIAVVGGIAGGYYGSKHFSNNWLRYILAFVLCIACVKLILT